MKLLQTGRLFICRFPAFSFLLLVVLVNLVVTLSFRMQHFQELDSYMVFDVLSQPERVVPDYVMYSYRAQEWSKGTEDKKPTSTSNLSGLFEHLPDSAYELIGKQIFFRRYHDKVASGQPLPVKPRRYSRLPDPVCR